MAISFTEQQKRDITRRQINLQKENDVHQIIVDGTNKNLVTLQSVDLANKVFYDFFDTQARAYESEYEQISGQVADKYSTGDTDLLVAAQSSTSQPFFPPVSGSNVYTNFIPLIQSGVFTNNKVKGLFHPTSTNSTYESTTLTSLVSMINRLNNGISGVFSASAASDLSAIIPPSQFSAVTVEVNISSGFTVNDYVYVNKGSASGLYQVTAVNLVGPPYSITIIGIIPSKIGMSGGGIEIDNTVSAFTDSEKQSLTSTKYTELLNNIAAASVVSGYPKSITSLVSEWNGFLSNSEAALTLQNDSRSIQLAENSASYNSVTSAISAVSVWASLPTTGSGLTMTKFMAASISNLMPSISQRIAAILTRISQIQTALGSSSANSLTQSGESFTSTDLTNSYYKRYLWLNVRINRVSGSLSRYYQTLNAKDQVSILYNNNLILSNEYDSYFSTTAIKFLDGSNIIQVNDFSKFSVGDVVSVISESQPEYSLGIVEKLGTNQLRLDRAIPVTYLTTDEESARIFKAL